MKSLWRTILALAICLVGLFAAGDQHIAHATYYAFTGWYTTPNAWCDDLYGRCIQTYNYPSTGHYYYGMQNHYHWASSNLDVFTDSPSKHCSAPQGWTNC